MKVNIPYMGGTLIFTGSVRRLLTPCCKLSPHKSQLPCYSSRT